MCVCVCVHVHVCTGICVCVYVFVCVCVCHAYIYMLRQGLIDLYNENSHILVFLLSTRAGEFLFVCLFIFVCLGGGGGERESISRKPS